MAYSDYLAVKKQKNNNISTKFNKFSNKRFSSERTLNNSYCNLQNTSTINEDGDLLENKRFHISLCNKKIYSKYNNTLASGFSFMYSIPKIHTPEYIKNQYQPSFCWTCWTPLGEITNTITCSVCDFNNEMQEIQNDGITEAYENTVKNPPPTSESFSNYIEKLLYEFDMAEDNKNKCENFDNHFDNENNEILYNLPSSFYDCNNNENNNIDENIEKPDGFVIDTNMYDIIHNFEKSNLF